MLQNVMFKTLTVSSASQLLLYFSRKRRDVEFLMETERFRNRTYVYTVYTVLLLSDFKYI